MYQNGQNVLLKMCQQGVHMSIAIVHLCMCAAQGREELIKHH